MITCSAYRLDKLFMLGVFEPALVQREYQWTTKECGQLLEDLYETFVGAGFDPPAPQAAEDANGVAGESEGKLVHNCESAPLTSGSRRRGRKREIPKDYFLGPIVLYPAPRTPDKFVIYDGLQRFTTLSILLSVLRDSFSGGDTNQWFELQQLLRTESGTVRLKAAAAGRTLTSITGSLGGSRTAWRGQTSLGDADLRMRDAAKLFHEKTADWSDEQRLAFVKFLREHAHFAVTRVDNRSVAYRIFVTANDRGLSLKIGDILKGRLVELVASKHGARAGDEVSRNWSRVQRAVRPRLDRFLRAVDFLETGEYRADEFGEALLDDFESLETADAAADWVGSELPTHAERFATLFKYEHSDPMIGVQISMRQLDFLQDDGWVPVAMALQWAYGGDYPTWARALSNLVRACYVLELLDWPAKRRAEEKYALAIEQLSRGEDPFKGRFASGEYGALSFSAKLRERARSALKSPFTDMARRGAMVHFIETLYWEGSLPQAPVNRTTVEHVLPRAATGAWITLFDENIRDLTTHKLGNLCLVTKDVNYEVGNAEFAVKRAFYASKLPQEFKTAHEVAAHDEWTPPIVEARTATIAAMVAKALQIEHPRSRR